jgi:hypothetical protein
VRRENLPFGAGGTGLGDVVSEDEGAGECIDGGADVCIGIALAFPFVFICRGDGCSVEVVERLLDVRLDSTVVPIGFVPNDSKSSILLDATAFGRTSIMTSSSSSLISPSSFSRSATLAIGIPKTVEIEPFLDALAFDAKLKGAKGDFIAKGGS